MEAKTLGAGACVLGLDEPVSWLAEGLAHVSPQLFIGELKVSEGTKGGVKCPWQGLSSLVVTLCRFNTALKLHVIPSDGRASIKVALLISCVCVILLEREPLGLEVRLSAGR